MLENIDHVCFDKDGTLIDVHAYWAHIIEQRSKLLIKKLNLSQVAEEKIAYAMGLDGKTRRLMPTGPVGYKPRNVVIKTVCLALSDFDCDISEADIGQIFKDLDIIMQSKNDYDIRPYDGILEVIQTLKRRGYLISVFSSDRNKNIIANLKELKIIDCFDAVLGGDDVTDGKPDPEGFYKICSMLGTTVDRSVYVGDTVDDMLMAKAASEHSGIAVLSGLGSTEELSAVTSQITQGIVSLCQLLPNHVSISTTQP